LFHITAIVFSGSRNISELGIFKRIIGLEDSQDVNLFKPTLL